MRISALTLLWATTAFAAPRKRDVATTTTTTTATAFTTDTVHVTVTDTAYVIAELPPCAATGPVEILTTVAPAPAASATGGGQQPNGASIVASVASQVAASPSGSATSGQGSSSGSGGSAAASTGNGSSGSNDSSGSTGDVPTLVPVIPGHIDPHANSTLQPSSNNSIAFQQNGTDGNSPYLFAEANVTYQYPTVILPHSALISSVQCASDGLIITFDNAAAYQYVKSHWTLNNGQGFLLVAEWQACMGGSAEDGGGHVYYLVSALGYDDSKETVHVTARILAIENALDEVDMQWGTYAPSGTNSSLPYGGGPAGNGDGSSSGNSTDNGSGSDNGGSIYNNGTILSCLNPPTSYQGLPTAPCGDDFDDTLDGELGYYDLDNSSIDADAFGPGAVADNSTIDARDFSALRRGTIRLNCRYNDAGQKISGHFSCKSSIPPRKPKISPAEREVIDKLNAEVAQYTEKLKLTVKDGLVDGLQPNFRKTWGASAGPTKLVDSKFGKGNSYLIYTGTKSNSPAAGSNRNASASLNVYCVDCKVQGAVTIAGALKFSILKFNVETAKLSLVGTAMASAKLGIAVEASFSDSFNKVIFEAPIPNAGFKIGGVVTVGAFTKLAATGQLDINAEGQLLVGATASIDKFEAVLDAVGSGSKISDLNPVFNKSFDASGQISVTAGLGLPMSLAVKVEIPLVKFNKELALVNTPSLTASATLKVSTDLADKEDCNNGLKYSVIAKDAFDFRLVDKIYPLGQINKTLISDCYVLPYARNKTVSATVVSSKPTKAARKLVDRAASTGSISVNSSFVSGGVTSTFAQPEASVSSNSLVSSGAATSVLSMSSFVESSAPSASLVDPAAIQAYDDGNVYNDTSVTDSDAEGLFNQSISGIDDANGATKNDLANATYLSIVDSTGSFCLATDDVGNFFLADSSDSGEFTYASREDIVFGVGDDMLFFYYPDEMNNLGVSRFRTKDLEHVPRTSQSISLTPINYDNDSGTPGYYAAVDTEENMYYLAVCSITDLDSKIFLVKDIDSGIETLADPNLQSVVTGGVVTGCVPLALKSAGAGF